MRVRRERRVHTGRHAAPLLRAPQHLAVHVQLLHRHGPAPDHGHLPENGVVRERHRRAAEQVRRRVRLRAEHRVLRAPRPGHEAVQRAGLPHSRPQADQQQPQVKHIKYPSGGRTYDRQPQWRH